MNKFQRQPYSASDYEQRIATSVREMVRQANEDMGGEVIAPDVTLVLPHGADWPAAFRADAGYDLL